MKRKVINIMFKVLEEIGINVTNNTQKSWRLLIGLFFLYIAIFDILLASLMNRKTFQDIITPAAYAGGGLIVVAGINGLFKHNHQVGTLLKNMDNNIFTYPDDNLLAVEYHGIMNEKNIIILYLTVLIFESVGYILVSTAPLVSLLLNGHITIFIFPYWTPWEINELQSELTMFLVQWILTTLGSWYYYVTLMFFIITAVELFRQSKRLKVAVSTLNYRTQIEACEIGFKNNSSIYDVVFSKQLKCCIEHHQGLIKNHKLFKPIFSAVFSYELATCTATFALLLYCLVLEASSIQTILNLVGLALLINVNFIGRCFIGQKFVELNTSIQDIIFYNTKWYEQSIENQQLLTIFHQQASYSFELFGISIFKACYTTLAQILRITYSYFNVLMNFSH